MSKATQRVEKLSLSQKLSRLGVRLRNARWRRYGMLLLAGKALFAALNSVGMLRVSKEGELRGLDLDPARDLSLSPS